MGEHVKIVRGDTTTFAIVEDEHFREIGKKHAAELGRTDEMKIQEVAAANAKRAVFSTLEEKTDAFNPAVESNVKVKSELPITL